MERYCNLTLQICRTTLVHHDGKFVAPIVFPHTKAHAGARHGYSCTPNHRGTSNGPFHTTHSPYFVKGRWPNLTGLPCIHLGAETKRSHSQKQLIFPIHLPQKNASL